MSNTKRKEKGPIEILCDEIDFRFSRKMERVDLLVSFVSVIVGHVGDMRMTQEAISEMTGHSPSDESAIFLGKVNDLLKLNDRQGLIDGASEIHSYSHGLGLEEAYPCDHLIDMLGSCVSAIRFGLEVPCHSRHAASAANHVWERAYGISRFDQYTSNWKNDWVRSQMQNAISNLAFKTESEINK